MFHNPTRRRTLGMLGAVGLWSSLAFAEDETPRAFMRQSIDNVKKNGQKFAPSSKMAFERAPRVIPFVDWDYYYLDGLLLWVPNAGTDFALVTVPKGFVTDLASVPRLAWSIFPKTGRYAYAAIVHDYLYWFQTRPKAEADKVLIAAMQDAGVSEATQVAFKTALDLAGQAAWDSKCEGEG